MTAGAIAFDPWAALRADQPQMPDHAAPNPPRAPNPTSGGMQHLGALGGLGAGEISEGSRASSTLDHDEAEATALAAHYAAPAAFDPWFPGKADPLRDGLLAAALARPTRAAEGRRSGARRQSGHPAADQQMALGTRPHAMEDS
jgi:hypothetical protein